MKTFHEVARLHCCVTQRQYEEFIQAINDNVGELNSRQEQSGDVKLETQGLVAEVSKILLRQHELQIVKAVYHLAEAGQPMHTFNIICAVTPQGQIDYRSGQPYLRGVTESEQRSVQRGLLSLVRRGILIRSLVRQPQGYSYEPALSWSITSWAPMDKGAEIDRLVEVYESEMDRLLANYVDSDMPYEDLRRHLQLLVFKHGSNVADASFERMVREDELRGVEPEELVDNE